MEIGYKPQVILSGRELNDGMAKYTAERMLDSMRENSISIINSKVLIMGITFKENCPDIRNTKTFDLIDVLLNAGCDISIYDPVADLSKLQTSKYHEFIVQNLQDNTYDGIAITVANEEFCSLSPSIIKGYCKEQHVIYDLKSILQNDIAAMRM